MESYAKASHSYKLYDSKNNYGPTASAVLIIEAKQFPGSRGLREDDACDRRLEFDRLVPVGPVK